MEKSQAWDFALGIIKVDNLKVSEEFLELVEKEKKKGNYRPRYKRLFG